MAGWRLRSHLTDRVRYGVSFKGTPLVQECALMLKVEQNSLGLEPKLKSSKTLSVDQEIMPVVHQKFAKIHEKYNELRLEMEGGYTLLFRAYNEGAAYRFETNLPQQEVKVFGEEALFNFAGDFRAYYPKEESFLFP